MILYRGIAVTYESIRQWCLKFAQSYANQIRHKRPKPANIWHLDEVQIKIKGKQYYLWRAVDKDGQVLDILMQPRRNSAAAHKFFRKLLKSQGFAPRVIITDKLKSYAAAKKKVLKGVEHRQHKGLNNRAENSHRPTRVREKRMGHFKSPGQAQRLLSAMEAIRGNFHPHQHKLSANEYRQMMSHQFESWQTIVRQDIAS